MTPETDVKRVHAMKMQKEREMFAKAWTSAFGGFVPLAISRFENHRANLTPLQMAYLDPCFRASIWRAEDRLSENASERRDAWRSEAFNRVKTGHAAALFALHAADGHLRELAVRHAPMNDAAAVAVLLLRCNDWVPQVRDAARARLLEMVPTMDRDALALQVLLVLDRAPYWQRGGAAAAKIFTDHPEWAAATKLALMQSVDGPVARVFRRLLATPDFDWALADLAMSATSGQVRAVAVQTLLQKQARWKIGEENHWIDRVFNKSRRVAVFEHRELIVSRETQQTVLQSACLDRDAGVRRAAADALILNGPPDNLGLVTILTQDPKPSVRDRMAFFERKWATKWILNTPKHERAEK